LFSGFIRVCSSSVIFAESLRPAFFSVKRCF
jgi:hypothetical protein